MQPPAPPWSSSTSHGGARTCWHTAPQRTCSPGARTSAAGHSRHSKTTAQNCTCKVCSRASSRSPTPRQQTQRPRPSMPKWKNRWCSFERAIHSTHNMQLAGVTKRLPTRFAALPSRARLDAVAEPLLVERAMDAFGHDAFEEPDAIARLRTNRTLVVVESLADRLHMKLSEVADWARIGPLPLADDVAATRAELQSAE